ncbi:MAG: helix-hairpin-helix domain-containing protein [Kofleriaceae bacterium]|nr:MAG: helix-hairpin-helix domain-containing protein [Kofleriaceae bacterium]MBZ0238385.1 helix-hairpin-helix domain-containing protein [Kofleriaceae bacterium]
MNDEKVTRGTWQRGLAVAALALVMAVSGVVWLSPRPAIAGPKALPGAAAPKKSAADDEPARPHGGKKAVTGKLNLNTATVEQLMMLPGIGPSKAERVVAWRGKHGPFKRVQDLRKVKGFGYRTLKKLEPNLAVKGESTLAPAS